MPTSLRYHIVENLLNEIKEKYGDNFTKLLEMEQLLSYVCSMLTQEEKMVFSSLFGQVVFLSQKHHVPFQTVRRIHALRRLTTKKQPNTTKEIPHNEYIKYYQALHHFFYLIWHPTNKPQPSSSAPTHSPHWTNPNEHTYVRAEVISIHEEEAFFECITHTSSSDIWRVSFSTNNSTTLPQHFPIWVGAQVNLIRPRIKASDKNALVKADAIILEPDFLIDISSLAECFITSLGVPQYHIYYTLRKSDEVPINLPIIKGNIINFFFDEILHIPYNEIDFNTTFKKTFRLMPFELTCCNKLEDRAYFLQFKAELQTSFQNLVRVIHKDFPSLNILSNECILEPSFFCEKYGIQGRLDLLHLYKHEDAPIHIIELKSGHAPAIVKKGNYSPLILKHEVQATLYRMMINTVYSLSPQDTSAAILYSESNVSGSNIRYAPYHQAFDYKILNVRNQIIYSEYRIAQSATEASQVFSENIKALENIDTNLPFFLQNKIKELSLLLQSISKQEHDYLFTFISFAARELFLHKTGSSSVSTTANVAHLWSSTFDERKSAKELYFNLNVEKFAEDTRGMLITFSYDAKEQTGVNFREGDLCIVYPHSESHQAVLHTQIYKGTITHLSTGYIEVRFRHKQVRLNTFSNSSLWIIEHDKMDHSIHAMSKNLFSFFKSNIQRRSLILGIDAPRSTLPNTKPALNESIDQQKKRIIQKAIAAQDYFLLVGPPGTGKTSVYIHDLVQHYYTNTQQHILVVAYTNRAVDELCEAITRATGSPDTYIRIGSEYSCGKGFSDRLMQNIAEKCSSRRSLKQVLLQTRIFVGTLAAIQGKKDIFAIKNFQLALVDEASQILEPSLINLLTLVPRFILIGDHKQLSTITLQSPTQSKITSQSLYNLGFRNSCESLFERLFRRASEQKWYNAFDTLTFQGRMHQDIATFINREFYDMQLCTIQDWQKEPIRFDTNNTNSNHHSDFQRIFSKKRVVFISTSSHQSAKEYRFDKINNVEAQLVAYAIKLFSLSHENTTNIAEKLGIITPYRNQIALIKEQISHLNTPQLSDVMVDTVERFQGSQRDTIIVSFCVNHPLQVQQLICMNDDLSVDRKLNVALSRARKHLILIGDKNLLCSNPLFGKLVADAYQIDESQLNWHNM